MAPAGVINHRVEIAFWTFREYEGQDIASFAFRELIKIAYEANIKMAITAKTPPEGFAKINV